MLERGVFDPDTAALLIEAFNRTIADLDLRNATDRERAAKIIIRHAQRQARIDPAKLHHDVVRLMRREGVRGHRRAF
jgi:hypothetical protein